MIGFLKRGLKGLMKRAAFWALSEDKSAKLLAKVTAQSSLQSLSDAGFLEVAYWMVLGREASEEDLGPWLGKLKDGTPRISVINGLFESDEFRGRLERAEDSRSIHRVRLEMVRTLIPPGDVVLDLGGVHHADPKGALLNFGYPHLPEKLFIVDLPPRGGTACADEKRIESYYTCRIEYVYRSMCDLDCFEDGMFDVVWSGQSIEHVSQEDACMTLSHIFRILKPGGRFALDTPNRKATILQNRDGYIHPEHKIEYRYDEMTKMLEEHGFKMDASKGLIGLSGSLKKNRLDWEEFYGNLSLNDKPDESYIFFICCSKPS
jgi:hypothetical protein